MKIDDIYTALLDLLWGRLILVIVLGVFSTIMIVGYLHDKLARTNAEDIADSFCKALEKTASKLPVEECRGVAGRPK